MEPSGLRGLCYGLHGKDLEAGLVDRTARLGLGKSTLVRYLRLFMGSNCVYEKAIWIRTCGDRQSLRVKGGTQSVHWGQWNLASLSITKLCVQFDRTSGIQLAHHRKDRERFGALEDPLVGSPATVVGNEYLVY